MPAMASHKEQTQMRTLCRQLCNQPRKRNHDVVTVQQLTLMADSRCFAHAAAQEEVREQSARESTVHVPAVAERSVSARDPATQRLNRQRMLDDIIHA